MRRVTALALLALSCGAPLAVRADVYHTARELLASHFARSQHVGYERLRPDADVRARIEARLGYPLPRPDYVLFRATTGSRVDGYAIFDAERGQHELIDIGTFFDPRGVITRVEILAYREPYGDGVRSARFLAQLAGRDRRSRFRVDHDLDAISGATISSRSVARAVERAAVLMGAALDRGAP